MTAKAIKINAELLKTFDNKIILDAHKCLPHLSLCMGVVQDEDIPEVTSILSDIARESFPLKLTAESVQAATLSAGNKISGLAIANTDDLQKLHNTVMQKLRSFLSYEAQAPMFYNPPEVEDITLTWVKGYSSKHDNPTLFRPHITVGFGETDRADTFALPIDFTASTLALCQLGNYCTCRKVYSTFSLSK